MLVLRLALVTGAPGVAGCSSGATPTDLHDPIRISLSVDTLDLFVSDRSLLVATITGADRERTGAPVTWSTSDPAVAVVVAGGVVTGVGPGRAEIRAEVLGANASAVVRVADLLDLTVPVEGHAGTNYYMNHYVAHSADGADPLDHMCGFKAPAGHDGTDFALADFEAMRAEVMVRAAAPGVVTEVHDGEANFSIHVDPQSPPNRVVLDHGQGRTTVYENLWEGTLLVSEGDTVQTGTPLGLVGSSGGSWIPHLHFEVRLNARVVDPFAGPCAGPLALWVQPVPYVDAFEVLRARVSDYQLRTAPHLAVDVPAAADTIFTGREFVAWVQELNAEVRSRSLIRLLDASGDLRHQAEQLRIAGPEGLTWFGTRISAIDETELGTWTMEYLYDEVVRRRVRFEMVKR